MDRYGKPKANRGGARGRKCLMCGGAFESEGAHNRICRKCKLTRTWREGGPDCTTHDWKRQT